MEAPGRPRAIFLRPDLGGVLGTTPGRSFRSAAPAPRWARVRRDPQDAPRPLKMRFFRAPIPITPGRSFRSAAPAPRWARVRRDPHDAPRPLKMRFFRAPIPITPGRNFRSAAPASRWARVRRDPQDTPRRPQMRFFCSHHYDRAPVSIDLASIWDQFWYRFWQSIFHQTNRLNDPLIV